MSYSETWNETFSITHARHIASRIAGDLRLMHTYYGYPKLDFIEKVLEELAQYLAAGYLSSFEIGFEKPGRQRVFTLLYEVNADGTLSDSRAGGVPADKDITGATAFNYLTSNQKFQNLSADERQKFEDSTPIKRTGAAALNDGHGYWTDDRSYSAGGAGVQRRQFVSYG